MPAVLGPAAQRINADVAGLTHVAADHTPPPGAPQAATAEEILHGSVPSEFGGLSHIFSDHLVEAPTFVETAVSKPTSSLVGRLGGLVPQHTTAQEPGPRSGLPPRTFPGGELPPNGATPVGWQTYVTRARRWLGL